MSDCLLSTEAVPDRVLFDGLHNFSFHQSEFFRFFESFHHMSAFRLRHDGNENFSLFHQLFELLICL